MADIERVAKALVKSEPAERREAVWRDFYEQMGALRLIASQNIMVHAGTDLRPPLMSSYVFSDSREVDADLLGAADLEADGACWVDLSASRPWAKRGIMGRKGRGSEIPADSSWRAFVHTQSAPSPGLSFALRIDHPDIYDFLNWRGCAADRVALVPDAFMDALARDGDWSLSYAGRASAVIPAADLWRAIVGECWGNERFRLIFTDRVRYSHGDPCVCQPQAALNLAAMIRSAPGGTPYLPTDVLEQAVQSAVRMLDNALDISRYPNAKLEAHALRMRGIGVGIVGLDKALDAFGLGYGSKARRRRASQWLEAIRGAALEVSSDLARIKGPCLAYGSDTISGRALSSLDPALRSRIDKFGLRNAGLFHVHPASATRRPAAFYSRKTPQLGWPARYDTLAICQSQIAMGAVVQSGIGGLVDWPVARPEAIGFLAFDYLCRQAYADGLGQLLFLKLDDISPAGTA